MAESIPNVYWVDMVPMTYCAPAVLQATGEYGGPYNAATLGVLMMAMQMTVITITNKILGARSSAMTGI